MRVSSFTDYKNGTQAGRHACTLANTRQSSCMRLNTHTHTLKKLYLEGWYMIGNKCKASSEKSLQLWNAMQTQEHNNAVDLKVSLFTPRTKPMLFNYTQYKTNSI